VRDNVSDHLFSPSVILGRDVSKILVDLLNNVLRDLIGNVRIRAPQIINGDVAVTFVEILLTAAIRLMQVEVVARIL
jgi:hypothetical protein